MITQHAVKALISVHVKMGAVRLVSPEHFCILQKFVFKGFVCRSSQSASAINVLDAEPWGRADVEPALSDPAAL